MWTAEIDGLGDIVDEVRLGQLPNYIASQSAAAILQATDRSDCLILCILANRKHPGTGSSLGNYCI